MLRPLLLGLVAVLAGPGSAFALRTVIIGNQPVTGFSTELRALLNVPERVYLADGPLGGDLNVYFHGGPKALNTALRRFADLSADRHEIILLPPPAEPLQWDKKPIAYDWQLATSAPGVGKCFALLTVYLPEPLPRAPADQDRARRWIADLGRDDFKTRERAERALADLGPSAAALFRQALKGRPNAEARARIDRLLAAVSRDIRLDVLELPAGVSVIGPDDLLARARAGLSSKDQAARENAPVSLTDCGVPAAEILPDLEKALTSETDSSLVMGAVWATYRLGAAARPLLPALRSAATSADPNVVRACKQAIESIENAKPEPAVPAAEATKRALIRKEIADFLKGRTGPAGR